MPNGTTGTRGSTGPGQPGEDRMRSQAGSAQMRFLQTSALSGNKEDATEQRFGKICLKKAQTSPTPHAAVST